MGIMGAFSYSASEEYGIIIAIVSFGAFMTLPDMIIYKAGTFPDSASISGGLSKLCQTEIFV
jgi:hypothetical protein